METRHDLRRREFLRQAGRVAATVAVGSRIAPAGAQAATAGPSADAIPTRTLGKTGLTLPMLGYGGAALPRAWRIPLSYEGRMALVRHAYDRGPF